MAKGILTETSVLDPTVPSIPDHRPADREIAARAYDIFLTRGSQDGHDLDDWLRAERELAKQAEEIPLRRAATG